MIEQRALHPQTVCNMPPICNKSVWLNFLTSYTFMQSTTKLLQEYVFRLFFALRKPWTLLQSGENVFVFTDE